MPKIPGVNHLEAVRALEKAGFAIIRQGKHIVMASGTRMVTIPRHNPVNAFTLGGIVRDAGLTVEQFRALLLSDNAALLHCRERRYASGTSLAWPRAVAQTLSFRNAPAAISVWSARKVTPENRAHGARYGATIATEGGKMKQISSLMLGLSALLLAGSPAAQTTYPEKPIRMVVGFPPGGQQDTVARLLGQKLAEALGKHFVVENVPGAAGNIGAERVAKAAPDGYTLGFLFIGQLVINPSLYKLAYDPAKDFAPVSQVTVAPYMLVVHNAVPAKSVKELVALAKAQPGGLTFASSGSGSPLHMAAELLKSMAGLDIRHIPYKGGPAAILDVLGGRVTMMFSTPVVGLPMVREGKLRALAVTSLRRSSAVPELPTIAESGYPGFEFTGWFGLLAPARTPATIVGKLHLETVKALALPDLRAKLDDLGLETIGNSPAEFAAVIKSEIPKWAKVIKDAGIKAD